MDTALESRATWSRQNTALESRATWSVEEGEGGRGGEAGLAHDGGGRALGGGERASGGFKDGIKEREGTVSRGNKACRGGECGHEPPSGRGGCAAMGRAYPAVRCLQGCLYYFCKSNKNRYLGGLGDVYAVNKPCARMAGAGGGGALRAPLAGCGGSSRPWFPGVSLEDSPHTPARILSPFGLKKRLGR